MAAGGRQHQMATGCWKRVTRDGSTKQVTPHACNKLKNDRIAAGYYKQKL